MLGLTWVSCVLGILGLLLMLQLLRRISPSLRSLTIVEMSQGIIGEAGSSMSIITCEGECTIISVWGHLGRRRSRGIQLGFATFFLLFHSSFLLWIIYYCDHLALENLLVWSLPLEEYGGLVWVRPGPPLHQLGQLDFYTSFSSIVLSAGLASYACIMYQIFYFYE